jgi:alpha-amylase/alpha-mannosidase (GH57 family)
MERYLCIHGHFYQPPRENPWLEAVEVQDSAYPYHDWNEKVSAECYAPNSASRILDGEGRIVAIRTNYGRISFNFGPTLLSWMESFSPEVYQAILDADRLSIEWRSGHGNAIAQGYNHIIMPLAAPADKKTQVIWGIRDFEMRFKRFPEGLWLPETAVDVETLDLLAGAGIKFTILAPRQAARVRKMGAQKWDEVRGGKIDPARAYRCVLPSGRAISIFFYDGPISQAVAFENLLNRGEDFANRLLAGFSDRRRWPQILSIATDGETYGHHHKFGDMALAYALNYIETNGHARLTNYGEYLERFPPGHEVEIYERTSWSCVHGIERWRSNCGCNTGGHPGWNQEWRTHLREALDRLSGALRSGFEQKAGEYLKDPWEARDEYIAVILDRSGPAVTGFLEAQAKRELKEEERSTVLKLLELQRHTLLMYTSCGWFFDDISGIETVQVLRYAGRAIQLAKEVLQTDLEPGFLEEIGRATSNVPRHGNGAVIYRKMVTPSMIDLTRVGVHYAVSSLFEDYGEKTSIYCYEAKREDYEMVQSGPRKLAVGRCDLTSAITLDRDLVSFCVLYLGDHSLNGGARTFIGEEAYRSMKGGMSEAFEKGDFADVVRLMDAHFGTHNYSLTDLFRDEQRKIVNLVIANVMEEFEDAYQQMFDRHCGLMGFLQEAGMPIPKAFLTAAEFALNVDLRKSFEEEEIVGERIKGIVDTIRKWDVSLFEVALEFSVRRKAEALMSALERGPGAPGLLPEVSKVIELSQSLPIDMNYWQLQNTYYRIIKGGYGNFAARAGSGDEEAAAWVKSFAHLGEILAFNVAAVAPKG